MNEQVSDTGSSEPLASVYVGFVCIFIHLIPLKNSCLEYTTYKRKSTKEQTTIYKTYT
jgi:hypothetical protein